MARKSQQIETYQIYTKQQALEQLKRLVDLFATDLPKLLEGNTKEARVEDKYIKPLFKLLNWNIHNAGLEHGREEFEVQASLNVGGTTIAPDYLFRLPDAATGAMRKVLFMEAKQPKYDLFRDIRWIRQAYRYSHSTLNVTDLAENRVPLVILTDFEEFRLFYCEDSTPLETNELDDFNKRVVPGFDLKFDQYVDNFDLLWDTFERGNVANGSLDRWRVTDEDLKKKRRAPDVKFLELLRSWRGQFAAAMFRADSTLSAGLLTAASQLLINRLVFLKMLADRGLEQDYLSELVARLTAGNRGDVPLFDTCKELFDRLHGLYNGDIFKHRKELDRVKVDNDTLLPILEKLRPEHSAFTLAAMPVEIIGSAYESFLGEIITIRDGQACLEQKAEVQKAGGVFYTPRYIVEYIISRMVSEKLKVCKKPEDVAKLRILDPSCGSGSFLIAVYEPCLTGMWLITGPLWTKALPLERNSTRLPPPLRTNRLMVCGGRVRHR